MSTSAHCLIVLLIYFACFPLYGMSRLFAAVIWQKQTVGAALPTVLCGDSVNWNISYNLAFGQALTFSDGILKQMIFKNLCKRTPSFSPLNFFGFLKTSWKESEASLNCDSCDYIGFFDKFFSVCHLSWLCRLHVVCFLMSRLVRPFPFCPAKTSHLITWVILEPSLVMTWLSEWESPQWIWVVTETMSLEELLRVTSSESESPEWLCYQSECGSLE